MKKIFTLLVGLSCITAVFAQSGRHGQNEIRSYQQTSPYSQGFERNNAISYDRGIHSDRRMDRYRFNRRWENFRFFNGNRRSRFDRYERRAW